MIKRKTGLRFIVYTILVCGVFLLMGGCTNPSATSSSPSNSSSATGSTSTSTPASTNKTYAQQVQPILTSEYSDRMQLESLLASANPYSDPRSVPNWNPRDINDPNWNAAIQTIMTNMHHSYNGLGNFAPTSTTSNYASFYSEAISAFSQDQQACNCITDLLASQSNNYGGPHYKDFITAPLYLKSADDAQTHAETLLQQAVDGY
jgi:hypothetical protein